MHRYTLDVLMITYNHENYIEEAINGVVKQFTNFNFRLLIFDDCSSDQTEKQINSVITHKNPNLTIEYHRNTHNIGMIANGKQSFEAINSKYVALCEGDDYWIDPYKLQKQVDFLEQNNSYGIVGTASEVKIVNDRITQKIDGGNQTLKLSFLVSNWVLNTSTLVFRSEYLILPKWMNLFENGDYIMTLSMAIKSNIYYLDDVTSVYRKHAQGISSQFSEKNVLENVVGIINRFISDPDFNLDENKKSQLLEGQYNFIKKTLKGVIIDELTLKEIHFILKDKIHESVKLYEFDSEKIEKLRVNVIKNISIYGTFKLLVKKITRKIFS